MDKTKKNILCYVLVLSIIVVFALVATEYKSNKYAQELQETFDEADRNRAIMELSGLRGRISEIQMLSYYLEIPDNVLQDELDNIISSQNFKNPYITNPYLTDFTFTIPHTSTIGELCDVLISQIYNQIYTIEHGVEGA